MQAVRGFLGIGDDSLPEDAAACLLGAELIHGVRTGHHPEGGPVGRQRLTYAAHWPSALLYATHAATPRRAPEGDGGQD